jgi:hypothetical protein
MFVSGSFKLERWMMLLAKKDLGWMMEIESFFKLAFALDVFMIRFSHAEKGLLCILTHVIHGQKYLHLI